MRTTVASIAAALALLVIATPAAADVVVDPTSAAQGDAAKLSFLIRNESPTASIVRVEMRLPADAPIAEVYPLSADDWAPAMTMRSLAAPLQSIHGPLITEAVASITWTAVEGRALPPGQTAELNLSVGPLPDVDRLTIEVAVTDSAGTVTRSSPSVALRAEAAAEDPPPAPVLEEKQSSYLPWTVAILAVIGLLTLWRLWANRRQSATEPDTESTKTLEELVHH